MHANPAAMKADLSLGQAPAVTDAAFAPAMRGAGKLLCVLTQHSLEGSDANRQTEALERPTPHLAKPLQGLEKAQSVSLW